MMQIYGVANAFVILIAIEMSPKDAFKGVSPLVDDNRVEGSFRNHNSENYATGK